MSLEAREIARIGEGLKACTLPAAQFHHREHCLATAYFLMSEPDADWASELPRIIRRYNLSMGGQNTESAGYHETITLFYLNSIAAFLNALPRSTLTEACDALLASPLAAKDYLARFYSAELIASPRSRLGFVAPDIPRP